MIASSSAHDTLRKVLLATDLSARCDRALARAVAIAADTSAHLVILHVFEEFQDSNLAYGGCPTPSRRVPPDAVEIARIRIREGINADVGEAVEQVTVLIEEGEPAEVIERVAASEGIELIVTGVAREGIFSSRPVILGRTVEKLLRRVPVPLLIVRNRPRASYRHILVTTDFFEASAHALQVALRFFPLHTPPAAERRRPVTLVEPGWSAQLVREVVPERGADLVVLGTQGRGAVLQALLGSSAKRILSVLPCDALVVRAPVPRLLRRERGWNSIEPASRSRG